MSILLSDSARQYIGMGRLDDADGSRKWQKDLFGELRVEC